ncbi:uncharacterized protein LOC126881488 isoform X1 [Diabrotica virgifera virgifera]|uniref:DUF4806 domain-containing protein n=1 Tax=Diabrotica virgifera virgifera TaxID=50390 RepID=A0ABM5JUW5_DIAVI|nr:uncharacterized protein LOC126881488 isoform X1 [Diabrotica virgifera virgifera]
MTEKTWTVVQFIDDATVEAVPSMWIQGNRCHWPSTLPIDKLNNAIRKNDPLNTCWPSHTVKTFRNATFDDYMTARKKAKVAEERSDLSSTDEHHKRKRIQKIVSSSDESLEENSTIIGPAPKFTIRNIKVTQEITKDALGSTRGSTQTETYPVNEQLLTSACQNIQCVEKDKMLKTLIQQGHILRGLVTETLAEVRVFRKEFKQYHTTTNETDTGHKFFQSYSMPIKNEEEFSIIEEALENKETLLNTITEVSKLGGATVYDFVRRAMILILTNEFANEYSWLGRKGKKPFHTTNIAKMVIRAAEVAGLTKSQKETEVSIQTWLRRASDRRNSGKIIKKF